MLLNVNGSLETKLECNDFLNMINAHDFIVLNECWTNKTSKLKIEGYKYLHKYRPKKKRARRFSGGLVVYIKEHIWDGIKEYKWVDFENGVVLKLCKSYFNFKRDIFVVCPYLVPSTSTRIITDTGVDIFDKLTDKLAELSDQGEIIVVGDLNSRTGTLNDLVNETLLEFDNNVEDIFLSNNNNLITASDLVNSNLSYTRCNQDKSVNEYGLKLIQLAKMSDLVILNGRSVDDKDGNITFCGHRGISAVDYFLVSKGVLQYYDSFSVGDINVHSDHCPVYLKLNCNLIPMSATNSINIRQVPKWKEDRKDDFINKLNSLESDNILNDIAVVLNNVNLCSNDIDDSVNQLCEVLTKAGLSHTTHTGHHNNYDKRDDWYDNDLRLAHNKFKEAELHFRLTGNIEDRVIMCKLRNAYRKACRIKRKAKQRNNANELLSLSKKDSRKFWKKIKNRNNENIGNCDFRTHFRSLLNATSLLGEEEESNAESWESEGVPVINDDLDRDITIDEIESCIKKLKNNKASGVDNILNEYIKYSSNKFKTVLVTLFNKILFLGYFPSIWAIGEILPIFKKGDINICENYRGITLLSCIGKLFTSILNVRLNEWAEANSVYCNNQFGFRAGRSTTDCIFVLHGMIELLLSKSNPLFCAFIDLKQAFDSANRQAIWLKLHNNNISNKLIVLLKDMYSKIKLCVRDNSSQMYSQTQLLESIFSNSDNSIDNDYFFASNTGVLQGESLSPFLFSMFLNDLEMTLNSEDGVGIVIQHFLISVLLFADDMVLFSGSRSGLQKGLDSLANYCDRWGLTVNENKTKCIAFKKGGKIAKADNWNYKNNQLETVSSFKYLGLMLSSSGSFAQTTQCLSDQGNRALFGLKKIIRNYPEMNPAMQLQLFNTLVKPILYYSCEIWGFRESDQLEKLHLRFLKSILGVRKSTPNAFVYSELDTFPLKADRLPRIIKYWLRILHLQDDNPVKIIYKLLLSDINENNNIINWASLVKKELYTIGLGHIWTNQSCTNVKLIQSEFEQRVKDIYKQEISSNINKLSCHRLYKALFQNFNICSEYLNTIDNLSLRIAISKIRLGSHNFLVERGRWNRPKLDYLERICQTCNVVEDEFHVCIECPKYVTLRLKYLPKYLITRPSVYKFLHFLNNVKGSGLTSFGIFCQKVLIIYEKEI